MTTEPNGKSPVLSPLDRGLELLAEEDRSASFRVVHESMLPTLAPNTTIEVSLARWPARRGDLVVFRQANYYAVHRLLGRVRGADGKEYLRTRGDGASVLDPPLDPARIVGQVVAFSRGGEWRSLSGPGPRMYAGAIVLHDLFWAGAAALAARFEGAIPLRSFVVWIDRTLLRWVDRLCFPLFHRRIPPPTARPRGSETIRTG